MFISPQADKAFGKYQGKKENPRGIFAKRLKRYAENGFWNHEGDDTPIRPEWDGVYRLGSTDTLFRLLGFYEDDAKHVFLIIDAYQKRGQQLNASDRKRIDRVAKIKKERQWIKRSRLT